MDTQLRELCSAFLSGDLEPRQLLHRCLQLTSSRTSAAHVDVDRAARCGFAEVIYAAGKPIDALLAIVETLKAHGHPVMATRVSADQETALREHYPEAIINRLARTFRLPSVSGEEQLVGRVAVVTAGTSDLPVSLEAQETLRWMNVDVLALDDLGVAGPHRLPAYVDELRGMDAAVVVAGMEGALPSIVGGYLDCPVIAVPTSVGYGASFQGVAALLGMLNSCAANVAVVNIDAGFKGGYLAGLIAHRERLRAQ
jgi:NCAIR mutase (PurE)-related protein